MPADQDVVAARPAPPVAGRTARRCRQAPGDGGFSLIEVLVAIVVIGTVMLAMTPFLVQSVVLVRQQRGQQVAVQLANDALERARALRPSSLLLGRSEQATAAQWKAPAAVLPYLAGMTRAWDEGAPVGDGLKAPLPTSPNPVVIGGVEYAQSWYVGRCTQLKADSSKAAVTVLPCGPIAPTATPATPATTATPAGLTDVPFFRVVAAVTWRHTSCGGQCAYVASTLVSTGTDVMFDLKRPLPTITDPGNRTAYVTETVNLQVLGVGGQLPRKWSVTGLPPGLTISVDGGLISGTPTKAGSYPVTVTVTDREPKTDTSSFTWTVLLLPVLTSPGDQISRTSTALTLPIAATGGAQPLAWSATGLPTGISINPLTGVLSGTPTVIRPPTPVTVTVADKGTPARTASVTFNWQVVIRPVELFPNPGPQSMAFGSNIGAFTPQAFYGVPPYTWSAVNLPVGLTMEPGKGTVTGAATSGTRYLTTLTVTDSTGVQASMTVVCNVTNPGTNLQTTAPTSDQTSTANTFVTLNALRTGGTAPFTWTDVNLPIGLKISTAGVITGTPTTVGSYVVTLTVKDSAAKTATLMFIWTVK